MALDVDTKLTTKDLPQLKDSRQDKKRDNNTDGPQFCKMNDIVDKVKCLRKVKKDGIPYQPNIISNGITASEKIRFVIQDLPGRKPCCLS